MYVFHGLNRFRTGKMNGQLCWCFPFLSMLGEGWCLYSFASGMGHVKKLPAMRSARTHITSSASLFFETKKKKNGESISDEALFCQFCQHAWQRSTNR